MQRENLQNDNPANSETYSVKIYEVKTKKTNKKVKLWITERAHKRKESRKHGEQLERLKELLLFLTPQSWINMRYMLDTCIVLFFANDFDLLDNNVADILREPENVLCVSAEVGRELVVGFNSHKFESKNWKTSKDFLRYVEKDLGIQILPVDKNVIATYSNLELNEAQEHKDPSDHIIISHAIVAGIPLITSDRKFPFYTKQGLELIMNSK